MRYDPATKVSEILKDKRGSIKQAPLGEGSPSWDDIQTMTWREIQEGAEQRRIGYRMIKKLLSSKEYDR